MSNLLDTELYALLPPNLQTAKARALSAAFAAEYRALVQYIRKTIIYADVMSLDENMCDLLALIFNISAYQQSLPINAKRELVRSAFTALKGTKESVQQVISAVHGSAKIKEWFEYGGKPYSFKIDVDITKTGAGADTYQRIIKNVNSYKNVRSVLDTVNFDISPQSSAYAGAVHETAEIIIIHPYIAGSLETTAKVHSGSGCFISHEILIQPKGSEA